MKVLLMMDERIDALEHQVKSLSTRLDASEQQVRQLQEQLAKNSSNSRTGPIT